MASIDRAFNHNLTFRFATPQLGLYGTSPRVDLLALDTWSLMDALGLPFDSSKPITQSALTMVDRCRASSPTSGHPKTPDVLEVALYAIATAGAGAQVSVASREPPEPRLKTTEDAQ